MNITMTVTGVAETIAAFAAKATQGVLAAKDAQQALSTEVAEHARSEHPWENQTGETEASIRVSEDGVRAGGASKFLEFGTIYMAARPFLRPAADSADIAGAKAVVAARLQ